MPRANEVSEGLSLDWRREPLLPPGLTQAGKTHSTDSGQVPAVQNLATELSNYCFAGGCDFAGELCAGGCCAGAG